MAWSWGGGGVEQCLRRQDAFDLHMQLTIPTPNLPQLLSTSCHMLPAIGQRLLQALPRYLLLLLPPSHSGHSRQTALPKLMTIAFKETEMFLLLLRRAACLFVYFWLGSGHTLHAKSMLGGGWVGVGNGTTGGGSGDLCCTASKQHMLPTSLSHPVLHIYQHQCIWHTHTCTDQTYIHTQCIYNLKGFLTLSRLALRWAR